ncbi:hypothetical protein [Nocardia sp. NPDC004415]
MNRTLTTALEQLDRAFASYPRRKLSAGCPHCRYPTPIDEHDLYSLTLHLGNTIGDRDDIKSLLPLLLHRLVTSADLDPNIVLSKLTQQHWRTWPPAEQQAIENYLDAVWHTMLTEFPSRTGAFDRAETFLDAAATTGESTEHFLETWSTTPGRAADRHLAELAITHNPTTRRRPETTAWLHREPLHDRLLTAFLRDQHTPWATALAAAYDHLTWQYSANQP